MRKIMMIVGIAILGISLAACAPNQVTENGSLYNDGTYAAEGDKWDFGHEEATVVISDGQIQQIDLKRIYTDGNEVDYDAYHEMGGPDLAQAIVELSANMLEEQSDDVDLVSGATVSSGNWKTAVERALSEAIKE